MHPRFSGENLEKNKIIYNRLSNLAAKHACTVPQLALAWLLHQGNDMIPIPGTTKVKNIKDNIGSLALKLTQEDLKEICNAVPIEDANHPRFTGENLDKNKIIYTRLSDLAIKHGCSVPQLALAWLLHQGDDIIPIPGTTKVKNIVDNIGSLALKLRQEDLKEISDAVPLDEVSGQRTLGVSVIAHSFHAHNWAGKISMEKKGTTKVKNLENNIGSLKVKLTEDDLKEICDIVPIEEEEMQNIKMRKSGNHLWLKVPGLAERRPSLVHGDYVFAMLASEDTTVYESIIRSSKAVSSLCEIKTRPESVPKKETSEGPDTRGGSRRIELSGSSTLNMMKLKSAAKRTSMFPWCCTAFSSAFETGDGYCFRYILRKPLILGFPLNQSRVASLSSFCTVKNGTSLYSLCSSEKHESFFTSDEEFSRF
ncbi:Aldo/keto reductase [Corchorus capsularis]|uniref:Aldo/keto reductase n=1 Tax=Corchorus capsularis TaxID=210143 RepID=A0A1R3G9B0_COCAP|nr:Aldo/keto reductase [Corchorus capsularis]